MPTWPVTQQGSEPPVPGAGALQQGLLQIDQNGLIAGGGTRQGMPRDCRTILGSADALFQHDIGHTFPGVAWPSLLSIGMPSHNFAFSRASPSVHPGARTQVMELTESTSNASQTPEFGMYLAGVGENARLVDVSLRGDQKNPRSRPTTTKASLRRRGQPIISGGERSKRLDIRLFRHLRVDRRSRQSVRGPMPDQPPGQPSASPRPPVCPPLWRLVRRVRTAGTHSGAGHDL